MSDITITPITLAGLTRRVRKWLNQRALRASQRNAEVLAEYIAFYQSELTAEHRRQARLSNAIKDIK